MPYADPEKKKEANRRWFESRGGAAAEMRARRARMTPEQREAERERDRQRKRTNPHIRASTASRNTDGSTS